MNANHLTICKFKSKDDPNFDLVASALKDMANEITVTASSASHYESTEPLLCLEYSDRPTGRVLGQDGSGAEQPLVAVAEEAER